MCFQDKNTLKTQSLQQHCQIDTKPCPINDLVFLCHEK